ncbi:MAG: sigma 54 modulation/S30EA ribosomal C-terminal domain-containing protein, partial [Rhodoglobus sp.]|nr:sigma 54 modulation/S30EA ribosomal C-terminal domain-containing protein [Rhodoglobus sp.]
AGADAAEGPFSDSPVVIRTKVFPETRMTTEDAVDHKEHVGHDFYLFVDSETDRPSVVYRRKGWDYGVISLESEETAQPLTVAGRRGSRQ